jgi:hypothetical protein
MSECRDQWTDIIEAARLDGICATGVLAAAETCLAALSELHRLRSPLARGAMFTGLVVSYARAFEEAEIEPSGRKRRFSIRRLPQDFDRAIHGALLQLRNEYQAHAGHFANDVQVLHLSASHEFPASGEISLGSRSRVSMAIDFKEDADLFRVRGHLEALRDGAEERLHATLKLHQDAFRERGAATGHLGIGSGHSLGDPVTGTFQEDGKLHISATPSVMWNSAPIDVPTLPLAFLGLFFELEEGTSQIKRVGKLPRAADRQVS